MSDLIEQIPSPSFQQDAPKTEAPSANSATGDSKEMIWQEKQKELKTPEEQSAWRRKLKQQDEELSLIMQGKKKREVEGSLDEEGKPKKAFVVEDDSETKDLSLEERRIRVIDKKTDYLLEEIGRQFGQDIAKEKVDVILGQLFGSQEERDQLRAKVIEERIKKGEEVNDVDIAREIEAGVDTELKEENIKFKKTSLEKAFGSAEYVGDVIEANIDAETFIGLIVGQEVGSGRYGSSPSKHKTEEFEISEILDNIQHKKKSLCTAFAVCNFKEISENWGEQEDPQNLDEILDVLNRSIYPNKRKSSLFIKSLLISAGYNKEAEAIDNEEKAQEMIKEVHNSLEAGR